MRNYIIKYTSTFPDSEKKSLIMQARNKKSVMEKFIELMWDKGEVDFAGSPIKIGYIPKSEITSPQKKKHIKMMEDWSIPSS